MNPARNLLALALAAAFGAAQAQEPVNADARYAARIDSRFAAFAGSSANLQNLASGLRHGEAIELKGGGESATVLPPTRPMGFGNITRSLDLASRQLAAIGITEPTPSEISAALNGGTVSTATGGVTLKGVLQLRSEGMGWGQIAHAIGVHPGMGSAKASPPAPVTGASGISTAAGTGVAVTGGNRQGQKVTPAASRGATVTTAAGGAAPSAAAGLHTPKAQGNVNAATGKGAGKS